MISVSFVEHCELRLEQTQKENHSDDNQNEQSKYYKQIMRQGYCSSSVNKISDQPNQEDES